MLLLLAFSRNMHFATRKFLYTFFFFHKTVTSACHSSHVLTIQGDMELHSTIPQALPGVAIGSGAQNQMCRVELCQGGHEAGVPPHLLPHGGVIPKNAAKKEPKLPRRERCRDFGCTWNLSGLHPWQAAADSSSKGLALNNKNILSLWPRVPSSKTDGMNEHQATHKDHPGPTISG